MNGREPPLIAHVLYRFDTGGLENGVVNLINHLPPGAYRHMVVALDTVNPSFAARLRRSDVEVVALHKPPGHALSLYPRLVRLLRAARPAIVHTRNLAALEVQAAAMLAGVPARVHGEHGRDESDPDGSSRRYRRVRRLYSPFVHRYVALSRDLERYLVDGVGIAQRRVVQIYNGVDTARFAPAPPGRPLAGCPFDAAGSFVVGTVGRLQGVKNQTLLAQAFVKAIAIAPEATARARLVIAGDGPLREPVREILAAAGVADRAWLAGERSDVPDVMRLLNCFALPSIAEGISNTILEAMSSALPVIATDVGGNAELVGHGRTGIIVPPGDVDAMAHGIAAMAADPARAASMGHQGRADAERRFSLQSMVAAYRDLYDRLLDRPGALLRTT